VNKLTREVIETLRRDFVAGLLAFVPVVATLVGVLWVLAQLDNLILPKVFDFFGMESDQPRFVGVLVTLGVIILAGALTRSFVGRTVLLMWEDLINRIPVARSLYLVLKQFMEAVFSDQGHSGFKKVVLVEYPRRGIWSYGFITGSMRSVSGDPPTDLVKVFIPKTPNPTTGYYVLMPRSDVRDSQLSVDEAFRAILSAGIASHQYDEPGAVVTLDAPREPRRERGEPEKDPLERAGS
jgi:uncharacterized membrane protein